MSKTEDYLDSLLDSISPEKKAKEERKKARGRKSLEFMEDFERELNSADMEDFIRDFEREVSEDDGSAYKEGDEDSFFDNLEGIVQKAKENAAGRQGEERPETVSGAEDEQEPDERTLSAEEPGVQTLSAEELEAQMPSAENLEEDSEEVYQVNTLEDDEWTETHSSEEQTDSGKTDDAKELLDMLADLQQDDGLFGLGEEPEADEYNAPEYDTEELPEEKAAPEANEGKMREKKKKKEKGGFFKKVTGLLFGEDEDGLEEDAPKAEDAEEESDEELAAMSEEDRQILMELNAAEKAGKDTGEDNKKKGKKKKKEKKPKEKKKEKKPKEKKAPREKKPKKPKKPKEVDLSPPLPKGPVILIFVMGISVILLVMLSSNLLGYSVNVSGARKSYAKQDYVGAYQQMAGVKVKEADAEFYDKILLLAKVQEEYNAGTVFYEIGEYNKSLDSYVCALGRYDANSADASAYGIQAEYDAMAEEIIAQLREKFGVTADTAREIYGTRDRTEYTIRVYNIVKELGLTE